MVAAGVNLIQRKSSQGGVRIVRKRTRTLSLKAGGQGDGGVRLADDEDPTPIESSWAM